MNNTLQLSFDSEELLLGTLMEMKASCDYNELDFSFDFDYSHRITLNLKGNKEKLLQFQQYFLCANQVISI